MMAAPDIYSLAWAGLRLWPRPFRVFFMAQLFGGATLTPPVLPGVCRGTAAAIEQAAKLRR
jgi:hypothetical protein